MIEINLFHPLVTFSQVGSQHLLRRYMASSLCYCFMGGCGGDIRDHHLSSGKTLARLINSARCQQVRVGPGVDFMRRPGGPGNTLHLAHGTETQLTP